MTPLAKTPKMAIVILLEVIVLEVIVLEVIVLNLIGLISSNKKRAYMTTHPPIVDPYNPPYLEYETLPFEEAIKKGSPNAKGEVVDEVSSALDATKHVLSSDCSNGLASHISNFLDESINFKIWKKEMPSKTPKEIAQYQQNIENADPILVNQEITEHGILLPEGQILFHGGVWGNEKKRLLSRPFSTTFCPLVARQSALKNAVSFEAERLDLFFLRIINPSTKAFVMKHKGTSLGHEKEVLFASGATLDLISEKLVSPLFKINNPDGGFWEIPFFVIEAKIS